MTKRLSFKIPSVWQFAKDLSHEITEDEITNGAATLAYYWLLALFPALIFLLSLLPYLPVENLYQELMGFIGEALPQESAALLSDVIQDITTKENKGLLSFGALATIWAASNGMFAIMRQLNKTYDAKEARSFIKARATALLMTVIFGVVVLMAFTLIVFGGYLQAWIVNLLGYENLWTLFFRVFRWLVIVSLLLLGFALVYYFGPDVKQNFRFMTPGSVVAVVPLVGASLGFQYYVNNFGNYAGTYGSIGAVIILMLWLYLTGLVILVGSEINVLLTYYQSEGKNKGQKAEVP
jgi:membrane protein